MNDRPNGVNRRDDPRPDLCDCPSPVQVQMCPGFGAVECSDCNRPVPETFGITWTQEMVDAHRADPRPVDASVAEQP